MEEVEEVSGDSPYNSMKEDPKYLISLVNKYVNVQLVKNFLYSGFVHSIDPVSKSVILCIPKEQEFQITLIPSHAVLSLSEVDPPANTEPPQTKISPSFSSEEISSKKLKLISWFKTNFLPVKEDGVNVVIGPVCVLPPYDATTIYAENAVVASEIRGIMGKMPVDFMAS